MSEEKNRGTEGRTRSKTLPKVAFVALFAALVAAGSFISVPIGPVPIILNNLFTMLAGLVLGPVLGGAAVGLYLLGGLVGLPIFAGGSSGIARFAGPTGGYLIGFLLSAIAVGLIARRPVAGEKLPFPRIVAAIVVGIVIVYIPGVFWLKSKLDLTWARALMVGAVPFLVGDALKGVAVALISRRLRRTAADVLDGTK
ncbi:MAG: biotin transporter BioY [Treponema sp.]|nr:biotin transporter BioY [Treponema sp.]